jgi:hypothetical protein
MSETDTSNLFRISFQNDCTFLEKKLFDTYTNTCAKLEEELSIQNIQKNYTIEVIFYNSTPQLLHEENFEILEEQKDDIIELFIKPVEHHTEDKCYFLGNSEETPYIWHRYDNYMSVTVYNNTGKTINGELKIPMNQNCPIMTETNYLVNNLTPQSGKEFLLKFPLETLQKLNDNDDIKNLPFIIQHNNKIIQLNLHVKII